jgi:hypothetical protein
MIEQKFLDLLQALSTDKSPHSGRTLSEHLKGTYKLLESWGNPSYVCIAGLFHSIYGTQYYKAQSANIEDRKRIAEIISPIAEELTYLFCTTDRSSFFLGVDQTSPVLVDTKTQQPIPVSISTLRALQEIEVANFIEQVKSAPASTKLIDRIKFIFDGGQELLSAKAKYELSHLFESAMQNPEKVALP